MSTTETHNEVTMNTPERMGYACINMQLSQPKNFGPNPKAQKVFTNRTMIRRTFNQKGVDYASSLALQNCIDLYQILKWNHENGFDFFRISSKCSIAFIILKLSKIILFSIGTFKSARISVFPSFISEDKFILSYLDGGLQHLCLH